MRFNQGKRSWLCENDTDITSAKDAILEFLGIVLGEMYAVEVRKK